MRYVICSLAILVAACLSQLEAGRKQKEELVQLQARVNGVGLTPNTERALMTLRTSQKGEEMVGALNYIKSKRTAVQKKVDKAENKVWKEMFTNGIKHAEATMQEVALEAAAMQVFGTTISQSEYQHQLVALRNETVQASTERRTKAKEPKQQSKQRFQLVDEKETERRLGLADKIFEWLDQHDIDWECSDEHYSKLLGTGLAVVGLSCDDAALDMRHWLSRKGKGRGLNYTHANKLSCLLQSKASPKLVEESGKLTSDLLWNRTKRIKAILIEDPALPRRIGADHPFLRPSSAKDRPVEAQRLHDRVVNGVKIGVHLPPLKILNYAKDCLKKGWWRAPANYLRGNGKIEAEGPVKSNQQVWRCGGGTMMPATANLFSKTCHLNLL
jgi:hypothetical protein